MAQISLLALFLTITNIVPVSAVGFLPIVLLSWRFFGRSYPGFFAPLAGFTFMAAASTLLYDPHSLIEFDFYRRDGNFFVSYAPIFAGCLYVHRWDLNKVLRTFFVFAVLANIPPYMLYVAHNGLTGMFRHQFDSFGSYFLARNAAGGFLAMLFCLGVACYLQRRSRLLIALLAANALMLFNTYSRGSLLGLIAVFPYLYLLRKRWALTAMLVSLLVISIGIAIYNTEPNVNYMGTPFTIYGEDSKTANVSIRYEWLWPRALAYFKQSPLIGLGFGSFDDRIGSVVSYFDIFGFPSDVFIEHTDSHAHNSYLNILAELGVVGLVLIMRFYYKLIAWSQRGAAYSALYGGGYNFAAFRFIEISSVCLLVMSATEHRLVSPSNVLILSLVISLVLSWRPSSPPLATGSGMRTGAAAPSPAAPERVAARQK